MKKKKKPGNKNTEEKNVNLLVKTVGKKKRQNPTKNKQPTSLWFGQKIKKKV